MIEKRIAKAFGLMRGDIDALKAKQLRHGVDGVDGVDGEHGTNGEPGKDGDPGKEGKQGDPGAAGTHGTNGTHGTPGKDARAEDVAQLVESRLRIPEDGGQGDPGAQGDPGSQGDPGPRGGIGPRGPRGNPGKSVDAVRVKGVDLFVTIDGKEKKVGSLKVNMPSSSAPPAHGGGGSGAASFKSGITWDANYFRGKEVPALTMAPDSGWLMMSNKTTSDGAAPQPIGDELPVFRGTLVPEQDEAKTVTIGMAITATQDGYVTGYEVDTVAGQTYEVFSVNGAGQINQLITFDAGITGVARFSINTLFLLAGSELSIFATTTDPNPDPVTFSGPWNYITPGGGGGPAQDPLPGEILHADRAQQVIKVHKINNDATDFSFPLGALTAGDTFQTQGLTWIIQQITDEGAFITFQVLPAVQAPSDGVGTFIFETVAATPITTSRDVDYWDDESLPNVRGLKVIDGNWEDATPTADAFGINLIVQDADISPDWDYMNSAGGAGGASNTGNRVEDEEIGLFETSVTQTPSGDGLAGGIVINYGVGGDTLDGEYTVASDGVVLTNEPSGGRQNRFKIGLRIGRSGAAGIAIPIIRFMYAPDGIVGNAVQVGGSFSVKIEDANTTWREAFDIGFAPVVGSVFFIEFFRDEAGNDSGELQAPQPTGTLAGLNPVATARLEIIKRLTV